MGEAGRRVGPTWALRVKSVIHDLVHKLDHRLEVVGNGVMHEAV